MSAPEQRFQELLQQLIAKPNVELDEESVITELDTLIDGLKPIQSIWYARAVLVRHGLSPFEELNSQREILNVYKELVAASPRDPELRLEASRAFIMFEEADVANEYIAAAFEIIGLSSTLRAVELKPTKYQEKTALRLSCVTEGCAADDDTEGTSESVTYVPLNSESQLDVPSFCNAEDKVKCTSRLTDLAYVGLLIQAEASLIDRPLNQGSSILPYVRRVTESENFDKIHWAIQERALYERSVHEAEDVEHIERGTVQLLEIAKSLYANTPDVESRTRYAYILPALSWRRVDDMTARRLLAMSDFANAVPFYERLKQPVELVMCYSAIGDTDKALQALDMPELAENAQAIMLRGDIEQNASHWEKAWSLGKIPEAKLRLAQKSAGDEDAPSVQKHLGDLLVVYPSNRSALYLSGMTALGMQDWALAAQQMRRALSIDEDDPRGWSSLSTALVYLEQPEQALVAIKQALRTDRNSEPDLKTLFNFVALSAQLASYDDVVSGLSQLCDLADKGSAQYVARVSGVLPRLVTHFVSEPYTSNGTQLRVVALFRDKLNLVIPEDDPMLARLTGKIEFWTSRYWAGFAAYATALKSTVKSAESGNQRDWVRVKLYATEYAEALQKNGDKEGRIEGSLACPDSKTKLEETQRLLEESARHLQ